MTAYADTGFLCSLHVVSALVLSAGDFLTFDTRQATLAKTAGLRLAILWHWVSFRWCLGRFETFPSAVGRRSAPVPTRP